MAVPHAVERVYFRMEVTESFLLLSHLAKNSCSRRVK